MLTIAAFKHTCYHTLRIIFSNYCQQVSGGKCIATSTVLMGAGDNALAPFGVKVMDSTLFPAKVHALIESARSRSRA